MNILLLVLFLDILGFGIIIPLLPFMALQQGADAQDVAWLIAAFPLMQLVFAPLWGRVSDRWGRRPILLMTFFAGAASLLIIGLATELWMLFAARALAGVLTGNVPAAEAYVADITESDRRAKGMGLVGAAFGLGFIIGAGLGAWLSGDPDAPNLSLPPFVAACGSALAFVITLFALKESVSKTRPAVEEEEGELELQVRALGRPNIGLTIAILFLVGYVVSSLESTFALWADATIGWGPRQVGIIFVFAGVVAVACQVFWVGPLARHFGEISVIEAAGLLLALGMALVPASGGTAWVYLALALIGGGVGMGNPALQSLISQQSRQDRTGRALGLGQSTLSLARVVGPACAGYLFVNAGRDWPYLVGALTMVPVLLLSVLLSRRMTRLRQASSQ